MRYEHERMELSSEGRERRDAILRDVSARLPGIASARRRRRRSVAGGAAVALLLVVGGAVVLTMQQRPANQPTLTPPNVAAPEAPPVNETPSIDFQIVRTNDEIDPTMIVRTDPEAINAMVVSDEELLRTLAEMGRPAGLIRMNGQVRLTRDVVDPPERGNGSM